MPGAQRRPTNQHPEYAIGAANHEPDSDVDASPRRSYMAGHARSKCNHRSCEAPPPSQPRYGASARVHLASKRSCRRVPRHRSLISWFADSA